jgi:hypothetical protein
LKARKFRYTLVAKLPYAIEFTPNAAGHSLKTVEAYLRSMGYVAYALRSGDGRGRLLAGAYRSREDASPLWEHLQGQGIAARIVER